MTKCALVTRHDCCAQRSADDAQLAEMEDRFSLADVLLFRQLAERALHTGPERNSRASLDVNAPPDAKCVWQQ